MKILGTISLALALVAQQAKFTSGIDVVTIDVAARDGGKVVTGLTAADFVVLDNGVKQDISDVTYGKLPIDITVALDVSYSVTGQQLQRLRVAVGQLMRDLGKDDRLRLMLFNERVRRVADFTSDVKSVEDAILSATAGGATAVFDTLSVAIVSADHPDRRQLIVLFTDGSDSMSFTDPKTLIDVAHHSNVTVSAVLPIATSSSMVRVNLPPSANEQLKVYRQLAADTGGVIVPLAVRTDVTSTFAKALDEFRSSYVLHFSPKGVERKGFHDLTVTVPANPKLTIRARKGYWAQ
jgi:Ca-activated chloride channel family protein